MRQGLGTDMHKVYNIKVPLSVPVANIFDISNLLKLIECTAFLFPRALQGRAASEWAWGFTNIIFFCLALYKTVQYSCLPSSLYPCLYLDEGKTKLQKEEAYSLNLLEMGLSPSLFLSPSLPPPSLSLSLSLSVAFPPCTHGALQRENIRPTTSLTLIDQRELGK